MGLPHGCSKEADMYFADKYKYIVDSDLGKGTMYFNSNSVKYPTFTVAGAFGDCTACVGNFLNINSPEEFDSVIPILQEYMSMNARISCFFSKKVEESSIDEWLTMLKKHNILGKHVQKSNREPHSSMYMISGIIKVVNPYINTYTSFRNCDVEKFETHDSHNAEKYNERAAMHKLYQFKE